MGKRFDKVRKCENSEINQITPVRAVFDLAVEICGNNTLFRKIIENDIVLADFEIS